jgi:hypothetical protein
MARSNPKPTEKTNWIPDDTTNIVPPSAGRKLVGWLFNIKPPAEIFNWFWNLKSRFEDYFAAQVEDWIVIDSDADEGDYATLTAFLADAPVSGNTLLVKEDQTVTVQTIIPSGVNLKFINGARLLCATNIATSVLRLDGDNNIEGVLNIVLSHTGTIDKAVEFNGDNAVGKINVENSSTGTLTTGYHINANKTGNQITGFIDNTGGGVLTNDIIDNSTEDSNRIIVVDAVNNQIRRSRGSYKFREGLEYDLGSDADGDIYYRDAGILKRLSKGLEGEVLVMNAGIPEWRGLNFGFVAQVGNDLNIAGITFPAITALSSTRIAFIDDTNDDLRVYDFDGVNWAQTGNDLNIATVALPSITALSSTRIAFIDDTNEDLRTYDFDGVNWAQVGNDLNIAGIAFPAITALNSTRIAFIDDTNKDLRTYDFDGTDWAQVGNDLNIVSTASASLAALNNTDIAFIDTTNEDLRVYNFDGTDWVQVGTDLNIAGIGTPSITALNSTDIAFIDTTNDDLRVYRWNGTYWAQVGTDLNIVGVAFGGITALNWSDIAFIDDANEDLRTYRKL